MYNLKEEIMKRKFLGFLFAFCLIIPCGAFLTACGGGTFSLKTNAQNATITLQTNEAKKGDTITFDVVVDEPTEDYLYKLERVYYVVEGSEQENVLTSETNTYSFTMPESNVTVCAQVNQIEVYNDFMFNNGTLTAYTGFDKDVVVPESYSLHDTGSNEMIISLKNKEEVEQFINDDGSFNYFIYSAGQYYVTATINGVESEEKFVTASELLNNESEDKVGYFENLLAQATESLNVKIRLTSYTVNEEDMAGSEATLGCIIRPLYELLSGKLSSFTMSTNDGRTIEVSQETFNEETMTSIGEIFSSLNSEMFPITYTYGNYYVMTEGSDFQVTGTSAPLEGLTNSAFYGLDFVESIVIPSTLTTISNGTFENCNNLTTVTIESETIYNALTDLNTCGDLIANATQIKVLKTIVDDTANINEFLNTTGGYTRTEDGNYYIYSK